MAYDGAILEFGRIELISFLQLDMTWNDETCVNRAKITPNAQDVRTLKPGH